jgi:hypothetical protein
VKPFVRKWVAFWDERESPTSIVMIRVLVAAVMLWDLTWVGIHGVPAWLWAPVQAGGVAQLYDPPLVYRIFAQTTSTAIGLWIVLVVAIVCFGIGFCTRTSALIFALAYAQAAMINDYGDRGIDRAVRIVMLILAFSAVGKAWSVDAKIKTGSFRGDGQPVPAWTRHLILCQLVLLYCAAGFSKGGTRWYPWGGYTALYVILQDPIFALADFSWLKHPILYNLTRLATAVTHLWEIGSPIILVTAYYRRTADRPGRLRSLINRLPVRNVYVAIGVTFHLMLAVTMRLGIFPFAMLAFFPAFYRPEELERMLSWLAMRRRALAIAPLLVFSACALFKRKEPVKEEPKGPESPAWIAKRQFYEKDGDKFRLYGVGAVDLPPIEKGNCPAPRTLASTALGRARAQLAGIIDGRRKVEPSYEMAAADVIGSEPAFGWYDGDRKIYVAAKMETSTVPPSLDTLEVHAPTGGIDAGAVIDTVRDAMQMKLDATGVCQDSHRRQTNKCCGGPARFCYDTKRYSRMLGPGQCACGQGLPCLFDFMCETGQQGSRCVCRGPKCPCEVLNCDPGETCGDGRCY